MDIPLQHARELNRDGFLKLAGAIDRTTLERLQRRVADLFVEEGERSGAEFKQEPGSRRLANLVDKGEIFREVILRETILAYVRHVLGDEFKLSSLNVRSVNPKTSVKQPLHADMAAVPDEIGFWVANVVTMLDDFTVDNGALRVVPGSHRKGATPQDALVDPLAPHANELLVTGSAGDIIILNAHTWHGGMPNHTAHPRTALHAFYCRRDKPQQQYQKALLREDVQRRLSPTLRHLLALDDVLNDQLSREVATRSGFLK